MRMSGRRPEMTSAVISATGTRMRSVETVFTIRFAFASAAASLEQASTELWSLAAQAAGWARFTLVRNIGASIGRLAAGGNRRADGCHSADRCAPARRRVTQPECVTCTFPQEQSGQAAAVSPVGGKLLQNADALRVDL